MAETVDKVFHCDAAGCRSRCTLSDRCDVDDPCHALDARGWRTVARPGGGHGHYCPAHHPPAAVPAPVFVTDDDGDPA